MLFEYRKHVYADGRYNDTLVHLPEIHFTASGFFLKIFDCLCIFVFIYFWSYFFFFFFFCESTYYEKQEKKH